MTITILDGGMSRELQRLGAPFRQPEWSALALIEAPDFVARVHADFVAAGATVITTNSYALVPFHIGEELFQAQGAELAARAGRVARKVADGTRGRQVRVAGSLPPVFGSYEPERFDPLRAGSYLSVLVGGLTSYVDLWLGETLSSIAEAEAACRAVAATSQPVWISFTLQDDAAACGSDPKLRSGERVADAAAWALGAGVAALLFNCSQPEVMEPAVKVAAEIFRKHGSSCPIGVYANAFEVVDEPEKANEGLSEVRDDLGPITYGHWADRWAEAGASIIGGCCGIGARHIHALADRFTCE